MCTSVQGGQGGKFVNERVGESVSESVNEGTNECARGRVNGRVCKDGVSECMS